MSDDGPRLAKLTFEGTPALARRLIATEDLLDVTVSAVQALCDTLVNMPHLHLPPETLENIADIRLVLVEALARRQGQGDE
jgi:hypothetical protein